MTRARGALPHALGALLAFAAAGTGAADDIDLTSGPTITGVIEQDTPQGLTVYIGIPPRLTFSRSEIKAIRRATPAENARLQAGWETSATAIGSAQVTAAATPQGGDRPAMPPQAAVRTGTRAGFRPPDFSARDLSGQQQTLARYRGRLLVLHFWASWCPHCRGEIPELLDLHNRGARDVKVLTVSVDEDPAALQRFIASAGLPYPVIADAQVSPPISSRYRVQGIPVTVVIGRDGLIAARLDGAGDIHGAVQRAMGAPASP